MTQAWASVSVSPNPPLGCFLRGEGLEMMEIFSLAFLSALLAIVVIDRVLAGLMAERRRKQAA